ncbi:MAG TPA: helix-turn-helix domain-containing protein [Pseudomonadales bacterium]|nr:helix-turn-helix domain-containing protein [Pseudomonadales bacterium]
MYHSYYGILFIMIMNSQDNFLTLDQAVSKLSTTRATFNRWLKSGQITGSKVGRQWRFRSEDIDRFLAGEEPVVKLSISPDKLIKSLTEIAKIEVPRKKTIEATAHLILIAAIKTGASDIHVDIVMREGKKTGIIRNRVDGIIHEYTTYDARLHKPLIQELKKFSNLDVTETKKAQLGRGSIVLSKEKEITIRANILPCVLGECFSGQILDPAATTLGFDWLVKAETGPKQNDLSRIKNALSCSRGLVLTTGPNKCGKSVTAYAMIHDLDLNKRMLITVEDQVDIGLTNAIQMSVNKSAQIDYPELIAAASRVAPDIVFIGEIRNPKVFAQALEAAESCLVIATMNSVDSIQALMKLHDWGTTSFELGDCVNLIQSQRLVRRLCRKCRVSYTDSDEDRALIRQIFTQHGKDTPDPLPELFTHSDKGCEVCHHRGHQGRSLIGETITLSKTLMESLALQANVNELLEIAIGEGTESLCLHAAEMLLDGVISLEEVRRVTGDLVNRAVLNS